MTKLNKKFRLLFATDVHLNFCHENRIKAFCRAMLQENPDAVVITGDISEAPYIVDHLGFLDLNMDAQCPIFFVLGNHDYYHGSITAMRAKMNKLFSYPEEYKKNLVPRLGYLGSSGVIPLTKDTALVGHDGWYDGRYANWFQSKVWLNDYNCIQELGDQQCPVPNLRFAKINELAQESADYITTQTEKAFKDFDHVVVATHVPPFRENAVYKGKISDDDWMPHFSSKAMGDALLSLAQTHPQKRLTVLCGHSHGSADVQHLDNLKCLTGPARYRNPKVVKVFEL